MVNKFWASQAGPLSGQEFTDWYMKYFATAKQELGPGRF
jgi:hypothetical protein